MNRVPPRLMAVLLAFAVSSAQAQHPATNKRPRKGNTTISGLVVAGIEKNLALRTRAGEFGFTTNDRTQVALKINTRMLRRLKGHTLSFKLHSSTQVLTYQIPKGPITGIVALRGHRQVDKALATARREKWIPEHGLQLKFGQPAVSSKATLRFIASYHIDLNHKGTS